MTRSGPAADEVATAQIVAWLRAYATAVAEAADELTRLDAAIGDADHGTNLHRGMSAVADLLDTLPDERAGGRPDVASVLKRTGMKLVSTVGGASGPLYGTFFLRMASAATGRAVLDPVGLARALRSGMNGVASRGRAAPGDKTMLDALAPACDGLESALVAGEPLAAAVDEAAHAAERGRDRTFPMIARRGRASYLSERSAGHLDPGATSAALLIRCLADTIGGGPGADRPVGGRAAEELTDETADR